LQLHRYCVFAVSNFYIFDIVSYMNRQYPVQW